MADGVPVCIGKIGAGSTVDPVLRRGEKPRRRVWWRCGSSLLPHRLAQPGMTKTWSNRGAAAGLCETAGADDSSGGRRRPACCFHVVAWLAGAWDRGASPSKARTYQLVCLARRVSFPASFRRATNATDRRKSLGDNRLRSSAARRSDAAARSRTVTEAHLSPSGARVSFLPSGFMAFLA